MQAVILAAGMGKRLKELTSNATKCMVEVNGQPMIDRTLGSLDRLGLNRIVMVVGYEGNKLINYIETLNINTKIEFVTNDIFDKTNNIYSLYLAKEYLIEDDTLLLESDIVFEDAVLRKLLDNPYPSLALVAKFESWMDGTVVTLDEEDNISSFISKNEFKFRESDEYYKTSNLYKFSKKFSQTHYVPFLEAYCKALGNNEYYEQVLKVIMHLDKPEIKAVRLEDEKWYEIDDIQDLDIAETLFASKSEKLEKMQKRFGGYWRYPGLLDYCYLVNPFFPNKKMISELKANFKTLLCQYPSGMGVNCLIAAKDFGLSQDQVCVGNGAAELIKSLMDYFDGKMGIAFPTFQEYPNRKREEEVIPYIVENDNYTYTADDLMNFYEDKDIKLLTLINPDNPSGNYIFRKDVLRISKWAEQKGIRFLVDESFVDFADAEEDTTLMSEEIIENNPNMIVVKSISKSFGVPGLRLGIMAADDRELIETVKKDVSIWNINSFGEYYLQIYEKYKSSYQEAMRKFKTVRVEFVEDLRSIPQIRVIPSQANYVLCEVKAGTSLELTENLLDRYRILIKDLANKKGFLGKNYIRLAVRNRSDNRKLVAALRDVFN